MGRDDSVVTAYLLVLHDRCRYLGARIQAKESLGWDTQYDEGERAALEWALGHLTADFSDRERAALQGDDWP